MNICNCFRSDRNRSKPRIVVDPFSKRRIISFRCIVSSVYFLICYHVELSPFCLVSSPRLFSIFCLFSPSDCRPVNRFSRGTKIKISTQRIRWILLRHFSNYFYNRIHVPFYRWFHPNLSRNGRGPKGAKIVHDSSAFQFWDNRHYTQFDSMIFFIVGLIFSWENMIFPTSNFNLSEKHDIRILNLGIFSLFIKIQDFALKIQAKLRTFF